MCVGWGGGYRLFHLCYICESVVVCAHELCVYGWICSVGGWGWSCCEVST